MTSPKTSPRAPSYLIAGLIAIAGGLVCASAALAQVPAPATDPSAPQPATSSSASTTNASTDEKPAAQPKRRGSRMVCKQEAILGTRLKSTRTCRTADEWRRISRGFQEQLKTTTDKGGAVFSSN